MTESLQLGFAVLVRTRGGVECADVTCDRWALLPATMDPTGNMPDAQDAATSGIPPPPLDEANLNAPFLLSAVKHPPTLPWPDISGRAKWSVSSAKFGFGVECLRDGDPDTFWHSDGPQPHFITIEFPRKVPVQKLSIYLCHPQDDSYTPSTLAIRAGTGASDLQDVRIITLEKPDGWITFDVSSEPNEDGDGLKPVKAYVLQIIVMSNHQSGKDTHVRGLRVLGPMEETDPLQEDVFLFKSPDYRMYAGIR